MQLFFIKFIHYVEFTNSFIFIIYLFIYRYIYLFMSLYNHFSSFIHALIPSSIHSFVDVFIHLSLHLFVFAFVHIFIHFSHSIQILRESLLSSIDFFRFIGKFNKNTIYSGIK